MIASAVKTELILLSLSFASGWAYLRKNDQLNVERGQGNTFHGFVEGETCFEPTYKYIPGAKIYDRRPEKKMRLPAWCDRILWKVSGGFSGMSSTKGGGRDGTAGKAGGDDLVQLLRYGRSEQVTSDHKPVHAVLNVQVKTIIKSKWVLHACVLFSIGSARLLLLITALPLNPSRNPDKRRCRVR